MFYVNIISRKKQTARRCCVVFLCCVCVLFLFLFLFFMEGTMMMEGTTQNCLVVLRRTHRRL